VTLRPPASFGSIRLKVEQTMAVDGYCPSSKTLSRKAKAQDMFVPA